VAPFPEEEEEDKQTDKHTHRSTRKVAALNGAACRSVVVIIISVLSNLVKDRIANILPPGGVRSIVMSMCVCLSVCLSVCLHRPNFTKRVAIIRCGADRFVDIPPPWGEVMRSSDETRSVR